MSVLPGDFTASKGFTLSLGGYTLRARSMSVFLLSVSFPYLGGVITFQVGRVTNLEGYNNIWRVRGRFDRGGGGDQGDEDGKGGMKSEL